jgi:hypothetical protein
VIRIIHIPDNLTRKLKSKKKLSSPIKEKEEAYILAIVKHEDAF